MEDSKLKEEARRIWKESDGWPYQAFVRFLFFVSGYWKDKEFSSKLVKITDIIIDVMAEGKKEDTNVQP